MPPFPRISGCALSVVLVLYPGNVITSSVHSVEHTVLLLPSFLHPWNVALSAGCILDFGISEETDKLVCPQEVPLWWVMVSDHSEAGNTEFVR